ncbi:hypothetical protein D3C87_29220 [compost metagenome]
MKLLIIKSIGMKVFGLIIYCLLSGALFGQDTLTNYSPSQVYKVCGRTNTGTGIFDSDKGFLCVNGKSRLYYEFYPDETVLLIGGTVQINFQVFTNSSATTPVSSGFRLFGPFDSNQNYTSVIEGNSIAPIEQGTVSTNVRSVLSTLEGGKRYVLEVTTNACEGYLMFTNVNTLSVFENCLNEIECENCLPKFQPVNDKYVVSAWVKEQTGSTSGAINYTHSQLKVTSGSNVYTFSPSGQIIDGWQRIEGIVQTNSVGNMKMELIVSSGTSYFDDIRVFPYDGSMITYVYDPITLRLMAELDERNYAKIYEYDEEGKLVRVKKETEKGIMTIQENRENSSINE